MQVPRTLTTLLALALLLTSAVGLAAAASDENDTATSESGRPARDHGHEPAAERKDARADHAADARAAHAEAKDARRDTMDKFRNDHRQVVGDWREARRDARDSYLENKTRIQEECKAMDTDNRSEIAACMREGLQPLRDQYHDALKDSRLTAKAHLVEILEAKLAALRATLGLRADHRGEHDAAPETNETTTETEASS